MTDDDEIRALIQEIFGEVRALRHQVEMLVRADADDGPPRCPRCGSYRWVYQGDRQVCADCGR